MTSPRNYYEELDALRSDYPDLTFESKGYEEIPDNVKEANAEGIAKVEEVLKQCVKSFVRFQNFKPRKDGTVAVRCQTRWSAGFTGVSYFPLENFQPDSED
jgi:hypothetical protein